MTPERQALRAEIDRVRLSIDQYEAALKRGANNIKRDALRNERLAAGEKLQRMWKRLAKSN